MIKLPNITGIVKVGRTFFMANRPEILLGAAVTATVGGTVLAAKGGYDARGLVEEAERGPRAEFKKINDLTTKEKIQLTWTCYMPAAITTVGALGSIGGLHLVHVKDKKALATAAVAAVEEVKKEMSSVLTTEEQKDITERILEKKADPDTGVARVMDSNGEIEEMYLVRDSKTGRDIWSNKIRIEDAMNEINAVIARQGDCELNLFYSMAGFDLTPDGDDWGWSGELVELHWDTTVRDDGRPVRRFAFRAAPKEGYDRTNA